jgi:hypothetical protein
MIAHGKEIRVFTGNSNPALAQSICQELYMSLGNATVSQFADGECSISVFEPVRGKDVFIVQSTCKSPVREKKSDTDNGFETVNDNLMELLIMIDALRRAYPQVRVSDDVAGYIMDIVSRARHNELLVNGVSARGSLALYRASQILPALNGRDYVIPEDVKREAMAVLPHRVTLVSNIHLDNDRFVANILEEVEVPLEKL